MTKRIVRSAQSAKVRRDQAGEKLAAKIFLAFCTQNGIPAPELQHKFAAPERRWAFDYAWPGNLGMVAIEVQGGIWVRGAHSRGAQQLKDFEKLNAAQLRGWRVFQVTPDQLCTTETLDLLRLTLNRRRTA